MSSAHRSSHSCDVLVLGAGAAGLSAACALAEAGLHVTVLEARDRAGGRILSIHGNITPVAAELGAEFVHGDAPETVERLRGAGSAVVDASGDHYIAVREKLRSMDREVHAIDRALSTAPRPRDTTSVQQYLDRIPLTPSARTVAKMFAEGFDAADTLRASAHSIVGEWSDDGALFADQSRPVHGYGAMIDAMARNARRLGVAFHFETVVHTVQWSSGRVEVTAARRKAAIHFIAKCAVVTLPLGVLKLPAERPGYVDFRPRLEMKSVALQHLESGSVVKLIMRFKQPFWETAAHEKYKDVSFFHSTSAPFPTFWNLLPVRAPILIAWAGGPKADVLASCGKSELVNKALESLRHIFGARTPQSGDVEDVLTHDWQADPFSNGAYSYVAVGGRDARRQLAEPVQHTLYFAGEATDTNGHAATVEGALRSGTRAATQILRRQDT